LKGYCLDEHVPLAVAEAVQRAGITVVTAHEKRMPSRSDPDHLSLAASEGFCLVTRNRDDFVTLAVQAWDLQHPHGGILIISPAFASADIGSLARALVQFAAEHPEDLWEYGLWWLQRA
jgi:hypothetical protein